MQTGLNYSVATLSAVLLAAGPTVAVDLSSRVPPEAAALTPEIAVRLSNPRPRAEEPFFVEVEVRWSGDLDRLLPHPPKLSLPASWKAGTLAAATRTDRGRSVVLYRIELIAAEPGVFRPGPVEIRWTLQDGALPAGALHGGALHGGTPRQSRLIEIPQVKVATAPLGRGSPASPPSASTPASKAAAGAAVLALLLGSGALLLRRIRRRVRLFSAVDRSLRSERHARARWEELLRQAVRLRRDGHPAEGVEVFGRILDEMGAESPLSKGRSEEIRYGGNPPRAEELDGLESRVLRELEPRTPATERPETTPLDTTRPDTTPPDTRDDPRESLHPMNA